MSDSQLIKELRFDDRLTFKTTTKEALIILYKVLLLVLNQRQF